MSKARALLTSLALLGLLSSANSVQAENAKINHLERIKQTKTLIIGYREGAIPFSYVMAKERPIGFGIDIAHKVADSIAQQLEIDGLQIRYQPVTILSRIPLMEVGALDIMCAQTTNTLARQQKVAFSNTYFVAEDAIALRSDSNVTQLADLKGARVAVTRGTTTQEHLTSVAIPMGFELVEASSNTLAMHLLTTGKVDAFIAAQPILMGLTALHTKPGQVRIVNTGQNPEAFGCLLPLGDQPFKTAVDDVMNKMMQDGEMESLFNRWFQQPIPPNNTVLGLKMSDATHQAYLHPNDKAL